MLAVIFVYFHMTWLNARPDSIPIYHMEQLDSLLHLEDDKIRVLNFWATWCKPCIEELPYFKSLPQEIDGVMVELKLLSLDFLSHYESRLVPFAEKNQISEFTSLLHAGNPNKWIDRVSPEWSGSIPATLIKYRGQRSFKEKGYHSTADLIQDIRLTLNSSTK